MKCKDDPAVPYPMFSGGNTLHNFVVRLTRIVADRDEALRTLFAGRKGGTSRCYSPDDFYF